MQEELELGWAAEQHLRQEEAGQQVLMGMGQEGVNGLAAELSRGGLGHGKWRAGLAANLSGAGVGSCGGVEGEAELAGPSWLDRLSTGLLETPEVMTLSHLLHVVDLMACVRGMLLLASHPLPSSTAPLAQSKVTHAFHPPPSTASLPPSSAPPEPAPSYPFSTVKGHSSPSHCPAISMASQVHGLSTEVGDAQRLTLPLLSCQLSIHLARHALGR